MPADISSFFRLILLRVVSIIRCNARSLISCHLFLILMTISLPAAFGQEGDVSGSQPDEDNVFELSPFEVKAAEEGYRSTDSNSATRVTLELKEIPFSISVVTSELLSDTSARDSNSVFEGESSTQSGTPFIQVQSTRPFIRGTTSSRFYVDGLFYNSLTSPDGATDRIEILKGPSGMLYGQAEPGGSINYVLKQAPEKHITKLETVLGSYEEFIFGVDWGGPISKDKKWRARISGEYQEKNDDWIDYFKSKGHDLYGRLRYQYKKDSYAQFTLFQNRRDLNGIPQANPHNPDFGTFNNVTAKTVIQDRYVDKGLPNILENGLISDSYNTLNPDSFADIVTNSAIIDFNHRFEGLGVLRLVGNWNHMKRDGWRPAGSFNKVVYGDVAQSQAIYDEFNGGEPIIEENGDILSLDSGDLRYSDTYGWSVVANWLSEFYWNDIRYKIVLGADFTFEQFVDQRFRSSWHYEFNGLTGVSRTIREFERYQPVMGNAFRPEEGLLRISPPLDTYTVGDGEFDNTVEGPGFYTFQFIDLFKGRLLFTAALRYDDYKLENETIRQDREPGDEGYNTVETGQGTFTTWSAGSVYNINSVMGIFGGWATTFRPVVGVLRDRDGNQFQAEPTTGEGGDIGVRFSLFEDRLSVSASGFLVRRENLNQRVSEITDEGFIVNFDIQTGTEESTGVELELAGQVTDHFSVRLGWTHFLSSELKNNPEAPLLEGQELRRTPEHKIVFSPRYEFELGKDRSLTVGAQYIGVFDDDIYPSGARFPIDERPYWEGYQVVNAFGYYDFRFREKYRVRFQLNVFNLFNEKYTEGRPQGPTRIRFTTKISF